MSFYHNVFAREHNLFVDAFRAQAAAHARRRLRAAQPRPARPGHPLPRRDRRRAVRGRAARRRGRDRQDPHHRVDAAAALRRAAVPRHERQLVRALFAASELVRPRSTKVAATASARRPTRRRRRSWYSVFAAGPGIFGLGNRVYADGDSRPRSEQDRLEPREPRPRQRRHQPLRLAVQLPGGVRHGLPAAPAGAGPASSTAQWDAEPERDPEQGPGGRDLPRPGDRRRCASAAWRTGRSRMGRQRLGALHAAEPSAVPAEPRDAAARQPDAARSTSPRSTSSATASGACRASTSSAGSTGCASSPASTTSSTRGCRRARPSAPSRSGWCGVLREVYGQHRCDASKIITEAQLNDDGTPINDCLGHPDGSHGRQRRGRRHRGRLAGGVHRGRTASPSPRPSSRCSS